MNAPFTPPALMPPEAPLPMPEQDLRRAPRAKPLPRDPWRVQAARVFVFGFALVLSVALGAVLHDWFHPGGVAPPEAALIGLGAFAAFWILLSVATAILGCLPQPAPARGPGPALDIAILAPIYGEPIETTLTNAGQLMYQLAPGRHRHTLYVLSDTRAPQSVQAEHDAVARLRRRLPGARVHYRHRAHNHRYKAGNIEDWMTRWGGAHDAMLVLDADSVMSADSVTLMADTLAAEPRLGLVQSVPRLIGARTLFARQQAFANTVYGTTLGRGLALWSGTAANYWGHNALIRVRAFAQAAGLPDLPGRRPLGGVILSHDFVEAALLRRSGWQVRFLPQAEASYETTPDSLIGHVLRDRRWCQGNLQHLRLLGTAGLHPLSRMHLLQGAMAYLASAVWAALMALWVLVGSRQWDEPVRYFTAANPLFPNWPEMEIVSRILIVGLTFGMLLAPKLLGAAMFWRGDPGLRSVGGPGRFIGAILLEVVVSVLLAPTMMVQHILAVARTLAGRDTGWKPAGPAERAAGGLLRFHAVEVMLGLTLGALYAAGMLSWWLLPIGVSLLLAPGLSWAGAAAPGWAGALFVTPQDGADRRGNTVAARRAPV